MRLHLAGAQVGKAAAHEIAPYVLGFVGDVFLSLWTSQLLGLLTFMV